MNRSLLQTPRTVIRSYALDDIERMVPIFSDPITMGFWQQPFTEEQIAAWLQRAIVQHERTGLGRMMITLRDTGEVIGDCGVMETEVNGNAEYDLGYIIHHPYWRQGYAVECAGAVLEHARTTGIERIVANMPHNHIGSERVAQRLGFKKEGEFLNKRNREIRTWLYVGEKI